MKELKWKKDSTLEELKQGEQTLKHVRYTFEVKRQEFFRFMAQSSPYAMQEKDFIFPV
ncbi:defective in meristem silencing 3 [Artemisia annua]|uniref:Defective in meristem silencing 3 n=1 Tax=Artemisia annua TaxID=35608 RepID=A0A2U1MYY1_ARTAN|nr:defective in meristem silencing 3 [Artemisia annua]